MPSIITAITKLFPDLNDDTVKRDIKKFATALFCIILSGFAIYKAIHSPVGTTGKYYAYTFLIVLPIVIGIFVLSPLFQKPLTLKSLYFAGAVGFVLFLAIYMFYRVLNPASVSLATSILRILFAFAVIIALAVVYRIFVRIITNMRGSAGFIFRILFFIPCLLVDLLESLFVELKSAPKMVVALFVLEILVILAYLYVLPLIKKPAMPDTINLLNKPVFLTKKTTIGTTEQLVDKSGQLLMDENGNQLKKIYYAVSMWVYINPQPNSYSSKYKTTIFRYGPAGLRYGHPRIVYYNDSNKTADQCIIYTSNQDADGVPISIPLQSWNHLVINYTESSVDIFINGDLVKSSEPNSSNLDISMADIIEVGYGNNSVSKSGVYGAICNVSYHKRPLQEFEIAATYNLNRYRNPPTYD